MEMETHIKIYLTLYVKYINILLLFIKYVRLITFKPEKTIKMWKEFYYFKKLY